MSSPFFLIIAVAVILGLIIYNFYFSREAVVKRRIRSAPSGKLSELLEGEVARISGTVEYIGKTLDAPLSGRKCIYFHVHVEQQHSNGKSSHWSDLVQEEEAGDVVIRDGNDYAIIQTTMLKTYLIQDRQYNSGFLNDASPVLREYLSGHGIDPENFLGLNKTIRYKEGILEKGETVQVAGRVRRIRKSETSLAIPSERIFIIEPGENEPVYFTDDAV